MQDFLHASHDEALHSIERFEKMISADKIEYFDVHQIENIYDFYFDKNQIKQAEHILKIGLQQHPQASSLQVKRAMLLVEKGQSDEALFVLNKIAPIENSNPDVFLTLGWIFLQKSERSKAIKHYNKAVQVSFEDKEDVLLEISYNLNQCEYYQESISFLEQLLDLKPNYEEALFEYAFALDKTLEYEKSISIYNRLLEVNPFSENAWYNLGIIYNKTGAFHEACHAYNYTLTINPTHEEAHFNLGNSLVQSGHFKEALNAYFEHLSLTRDKGLCYQYIGDCWEQLGNYSLAIRFYKLTIQLMPKQADAWYGLGTTLMETCNFAGGLQAIDQAISINPVNADYWFAHARGLFEMEKTEDAVRSLENGLNLDPNELTAWFELLKLKLFLSDRFDTAHYLTELTQRYPDTAAVWYLNAIGHFHYLKNKEEAIVAFYNAISIDPEGYKDIQEDYPDLMEDKDIKKIIQQYS
ncbi:MAG: tetratricopeptide repeat protein [Carboxylicivirga sp.]|nr:tetratricopeptide repeat protein [Carboxylicivirga sp.]